MNESALVSCEWLNRHLGDENQVILDATFFLPRQQRNALAEYQQHIPGAQYFDIDKVANLENSLPHTLPNAEQFAEAVGKMGIDNKTHVLIYDNNHFFAAARVWWMFRVFGHHSVRIVDGGLANWLKSGFKIDSQQSFPIKKIFFSRYRPELFFNLKQMVKAQQSSCYQIIDARSTDSFLGQRPVAGSDVQLGHIPKSINIPYMSLIDNKKKTLLSTQKLLICFEKASIDLSKPLITTCGSGVSAALLTLALYQIGLTEVPLYDGSWAEWGRQKDTQKTR